MTCMIQNWFGIRCLLHMCPFRPDSLGAYCALGSCNRRITILGKHYLEWCREVEYKRSAKELPPTKPEQHFKMEAIQWQEMPSRLMSRPWKSSTRYKQKSLHSMHESLHWKALLRRRQNQDQDPNPSHPIPIQDQELVSKQSVLPH